MLQQGTKCCFNALRALPDYLYLANYKNYTVFRGDKALLGSDAFKKLTVDQKDLVKKYLG
jgi:hypothetical protein